MPEWFWIVLFSNARRRDLKVLDQRPTEAPAPYSEFVVVDMTIDRATAEWVVERWTKSDGVGGFEQIWQEVSCSNSQGARWSVIKELTVAQEENARMHAELARMQSMHHYVLFKRLSGQSI